MTRLIPIQSTDYSALAAFCASKPERTLALDLWERRFRFWWDENPAFQTGWVRGWMLQDETSIVGVLVDIPSHIQLLGQMVTVSNLSLLRILPEHQQESIRLLSALLTDTKSRPVFCTTTTPELASVLRGFRFRNLTEYFIEHLFVTNTSFLAGQLIQKKKLPQFLAYPAAMVTRLFQKVYGWIDSSRTGNLHVRLLHDAGPEFDRLWQRTDHQFSFTNLRSASDLNWILCSNPVHHLVLFGCYTCDETLIGYGLFVHLSTENPENTGRLLCLDLWSEWTSITPFVAMIRGAIRYSEKKRLSMLIVPEYHEIIGRAVAQSGFSIRRIFPATLYCRLPRGVALGINSEESRLSGYFGDTVL
ncbi:MAG: hypothetical protein H7833_10740 [Magnetococcus sp. DMHC-1]|nr:hypothetical protein [Magnetococcales bacterium]